MPVQANAQRPERIYGRTLVANRLFRAENRLMDRRLLRLSCAFLWVGLLQAENLTLERLFTRPYVWGTSPEHLKWSKRNHTLVFLWNASGRRFLDLYAYHADRQELVRLTDLESQKDDLTLTPDEKDARQKQYPMPLPGIAAPFDVSADGARATFVYRGDIFVAATASTKPLLRLTRTKEAESAPHFSPDGGRIAYLRAGQIYVHNPGDGSLADH